MTDRYVCIHGHFYQPPRENPWLEVIEVQDSAHPYRDWNERITAECYSTNSAARLLGRGRRIEAITNNYARMSFNFGPTLLSWLEDHAPDTYGAILEADRESLTRFSGHGSALAQVYNHIIMPLAGERDKRTQIEWGLADFIRRFSRFPEGMWLAETAVDTATLELLAEYGLRFTILAPRQAASFRQSGVTGWQELNGTPIDHRRAYRANLPSGRGIDIFFYDGAIAQEVAFGSLLSNGERFAQRLVSAFSEESDEPELSHIATDGETYGHHHKFGEMALAYCLSHIEENRLAKLTVYGEFLDIAPPSREVRILENSSWSCSHGVERWREDCGCSSGRAGWTQMWRGPLRQTFDWLRDLTGPFYQEQMEEFSADPWEIRNRYIRVILNRDPDSLEAFFTSLGLTESPPGENTGGHMGFPPGGRAGTRTAAAPEVEHSSGRGRVRRKREKLLKLLEMQRHLLLMYTSCGWFFDELSGIETVQTIQYAARALQLATELGMGAAESEFIDRLESIPSNIPRVQNGRRVYELYVRPSVVDLYRVAAHYGVSSLWSGNPGTHRVFSYEVETGDYERLEAGRYRMVIGRARFRSVITLEEETLAFAFLHLGDHNLNGGVRKSRDLENYLSMKEQLHAAFRRLSVSDILLLLDRHFGSHSYSLISLFREESRKIYSRIMESALREIEHSFRGIYQDNYPIMQSLVDTGTPLPTAIRTPVDYIINTDILRVLSAAGPTDTERLRRLHDEVLKWSVNLEKSEIAYAATRKITAEMEELARHPSDAAIITRTGETLKILLGISITPDLWKPQNILFSLWGGPYAEVKEQVEHWGSMQTPLAKELLKLEELLNSDIAVQE